jgi:hypothetical protein
MTGKAEEIIKWLFNQDREKLFDITEHWEKRSRDANALLWACLGELAGALRSDKWTVYLQMLKRYGQYTYICVKPKAVEAIKKQWRECEEIGHITIDGQDSVQMLCYFGSSTYNSKEFSILLDGVISEMKELGLDTPADRELKRAIRQMEEKEK